MSLPVDDRSPTPKAQVTDLGLRSRDYLPEVASSPVGLATELASAIGARVEPVLVPWDCADGFFEAYWRRPEVYLDEEVRRGISVWTAVGQTPSSERCAVSALTSHLVGGPNATTTCSISTPAELGLRLVIT